MGTLKVGDRVKHIGCTCPQNGKSGAVTELKDWSSCMVKFDNGPNVWCAFAGLEKLLKTYDADKVEVRFGGVLLKGEDLDDRVTAKRAKLRYSLIPADVLEMLAKVFDFGAKKHDEDEGWKSLDPQLYEDALMRHLQEVRKGNLIDPESGLPHRAHVLCNAAMILWHELNKEKK